MADRSTFRIDRLLAGCTPAAPLKTVAGPVCQTLSFFDVVHPQLQIHKEKVLHGEVSGGIELNSICKTIFKQMHKSKRTRTSFTLEQLDELEECFKLNHYVTSSERKVIASKLGLNETQVKVWFQNRRTKQKRITGDNEERTKAVNFNSRESSFE